MFELNDSVVNTIVDLGLDIVNQQNIHKDFDLSTEKRKRHIVIDGGIDCRKKTVDVTLRYRSEPNYKVRF